ncbi:MAG: YcbK family protein [Alphaproteobacteria bacterium]|nr:YcbK family protein [Alphaproteobacteria bacterium]
MSELVLSRRKFLVLGSSFMAVAATPSFATLILPKQSLRFSTRKLALYNIHTGETFEGPYWRENAYDKKALERLTHVLRDRRNNKKLPMDPRLFDALHRLQAKLGTKDPFQVICGYRSPETNAKLHRTSSGVAKNSLHVKGKAIDVSLEHLPLKELSNAARSLKVGGVGYYPKSNFVHIDIRPKPAFWT